MDPCRPRVCHPSRQHRSMLPPRPASAPPRNPSCAPCLARLCLVGCRFLLHRVCLPPVPFTFLKLCVVCVTGLLLCLLASFVALCIVWLLYLSPFSALCVVRDHLPVSLFVVRSSCIHR